MIALTIQNFDTMMMLKYQMVILKFEMVILIYHIVFPWGNVSTLVTVAPQ